jgi:hypothetical protein
LLHRTQNYLLKIYIMKKVIPFLSVLSLFITSFLYGQQTVEKRLYYDLFETQIKEIYHVTGDGLLHGKVKQFYLSGARVEADFFYGNCTTYKEWDKAGNLILHIQKNTMGQFNGEQKKYKIVLGKPVLVKYAKINNGNVIEYRRINDDGDGIVESYSQNIFKKFDQNGEVLYTMQVGDINGVFPFNKIESITFENNRITKITKKEFTLELLPNKTHFFYKANDGWEGFYKLKDNNSNIIELQKIYIKEWRVYGTGMFLEIGIDDFFLEMEFSDNDFRFFENKIFNGNLAIKDSTWTWKTKGQLATEETYKNGAITYRKTFFENNEIQKEEKVCARTGR